MVSGGAAAMRGEGKVGELVLALTALVAGHAIPSAPVVRPALVARLGRAGFGAAYGLISLALLLW
ncbi:MAG: NnrU family protein, partial [Pseudomonadota bacterium]